MKTRSTSPAPPLNDPNPPTISMSSALLLLGVTLLVYGNLVRADFSGLDDPYNISQNPSFNPPTLANIAQYWTTQNVHGLYIPLTYTAWGILAMAAYVPTPDAWGVHLNPSVFHLANVVLHAGSVLAAFALLHRLLQNQVAACIGAMLFSLHPLQVEAVGWAAGLKDVLSGMFSLIALWQYVAYAQGESRRSRRAYWIATAALILAMLAKPSAMMTPLIAFVIDRWLVRRETSRVLSSLALWLILGLSCAVNARIAQEVSSVDPVPTLNRLLVVGDALAFYIGKIVVPINLAVDYGRKPAVVLSQSWVYIAWIVPAMVAAAMIRLRKRNPVLLVGGAIFVLAIAPVLGFTPFLYQQFSTTADHYLYLAMLGPALIAGSCIARWKGRIAVRCASVALLLLGIASVRQTQVWQSSTALFTHALTITPSSTLVMNNLGHGYLVEDRFAEAQALFERVLALEPNNLRAKANLDYVVTIRAAQAASQPSTTPTSTAAQ